MAAVALSVCEMMEETNIMEQVILDSRLLDMTKELNGEKQLISLSPL